MLNPTEFRSFVGSAFDSRDLDAVTAAGREAKAAKDWFLTNYAKAAYMLLTDSPVAPVAAPKPAVTVAPLTPGFYTVEFEGGEYVTLRVQEDFRQTPDPNCRVIGFLSGADNTGDYTGFAFVVGGQVRTWKRFQGKAPRQHAALNVLMGATDSTEYGKAYARRSGNCYKCNRTLTTPESIAAGIGPVCAGKE